MLDLLMAATVLATTLVQEKSAREGALFRNGWRFVQPEVSAPLTTRTLLPVWNAG